MHEAHANNTDSTGSDDPHCDFAALMQAINDAITSGDISTLSSDATYQACAAVADIIGEVQIASECPGGGGP